MLMTSAGAGEMPQFRRNLDLATLSTESHPETPRSF